ncbi:MAG TPA: pyridoxamine 5'-phosphate oxidase family protein [Candidatus Acidoferrales bacterium]|nr:pyridoxamine 5'-phosphate oxidase family protein [Candidatus Acidoferrales bacterium]
MPTERVRVRRLPKRASYERAVLDAILDAGMLCHVGFVPDATPVVIPTLYWRDGDVVYFHGSSASRMLKAVTAHDVCLTVTLLDAMVLTRSAFHHSANYRSAMLFGKPFLVDDDRERLAQMQLFVDSLYPGRWSTLRPVSDVELKATRILGLTIGEFSVKRREGGPEDDPADYAWPVWGGIIPICERAGEPEPDSHQPGCAMPSPRLNRLS